MPGRLKQFDWPCQHNFHQSQRCNRPTCQATRKMQGTSLVGSQKMGIVNVPVFNRDRRLEQCQSLLWANYLYDLQLGISHIDVPDGDIQGKLGLVVRKVGSSQSRRESKDWRLCSSCRMRGSMASRCLQAWVVISWI